MADLDLDDRLEAAEQTLLRDRIALELLRTKQEVLQKYTRDKMIKTLEVDVERKHSEELVKQATLRLEMNKAGNLERQIARCTLRAPSAGMIVYHPQIEEGARFASARRSSASPI